MESEPKLPIRLCEGNHQHIGQLHMDPPLRAHRSELRCAELYDKAVLHWTQDKSNSLRVHPHLPMERRLPCMPAKLFGRKQFNWQLQPDYVPMLPRILLEHHDSRLC